METPNTEAGRLTETIMADIRNRILIENKTYNIIYEEVLKNLSLKFVPQSGVVKFPGGGGMFVNTGGMLSNKPR